MSNPLMCRSCGSTKTREQLTAEGWINCCPERAMNEVIERDRGVPALVEQEQSND